MSERIRQGRRPDRLRLDDHHGWLAGVCAGIARRLGTDVAYVRVAAVISLLFFPKVSIAAYLIAWVVLDRDPSRR